MRQIICVFSDESGVFNRNNNRFFVFGGLILNASNGEVGKISRLYSRSSQTSIIPRQMENMS